MFWLFIGILLLFALTVFKGAPYVPTHRRQVEVALDLLELQAGDVVVDLGSGDGAVLKAAAKRGLVAYGYEINPILCLVAWLRCWRYRKRVRIVWADLWRVRLPDETKGVFIFAGGPFMLRLAKKLTDESAGLGKPFRVASYGFALPGVTLAKAAEAVNVYQFPQTLSNKSGK